MSANLQALEEAGFFVNRHGYWFFLEVNCFNLPIMKANRETEQMFIEHMNACGIDIDDQLAVYMMDYAIHVDAEKIYDSRGFGEPYHSVNDILNYEV